MMTDKERIESLQQQIDSILKPRYTCDTCEDCDRCEFAYDEYNIIKPNKKEKCLLDDVAYPGNW